MSSTMFGADIDQLRSLASVFEDRSAQLQSAIELVGGQVEQVPWFGPGAEMFRDEWSGVHAPALRDAAGSLLTGAAALRRNADDQESTSGDLAGAGVQSAPGGPGVPGGGPDGDGGGSGGDGGIDLFPDWLTDIQNGATWAGLFHDLNEGILRSNVDDWAKLGNTGKWLGGLGTGLAGLGAGLGLYQTVTGIADGNGWQVSDGLVNTGLGVAGLLVTAGTPAGWVVLGAGAAWAGAGVLANHLGYDSTSEMFVDAGKWVGNTVADGAEAAWDGVEEAAGAVADAGEALADGASSAVDTIKGWF